ncbi:hypothetical protein BDV27DRAFT_165989 [Aspergillus caelatus]|uniref:Caspase domain-containing protein n=1 Tax=Aspergillus caelatus TaxID=61420 RepID=A0A5N7A0L0_9EURO|nr:uncharacterized protein BDV27DRAFT_165989 [Aspergillus caelatus]KAE8362719.1 hypothetical protein BDV27DRAFT_165989 [Aspergillus caelatus]
MSTASHEPHGLSISGFEEMLRRAVSQRSRVYSFVSSLSIRWENDQTNAEGDCNKFRDIVHLFGFPTPEQYVIPLEDRAPTMALNHKFWGMLCQALTTNGRALLLVHYAGHGVEKEGELFFTSGNHRYSIAIMRILAQVDTNSLFLSSNTEVDTVFIFDSCFSHVATRNSVYTERIVEVLAATSPRTPLANAAQGRASFTGKLWNEIMAKRAAGHKSVELAQLMDTLMTNSPRVTPSYKLLVGVHSLRLELPGGSVSNVAPPPVVEPEYFAVFSVYVAESLAKSALDTLTEWIHALPRNIGLTLDNVYVTSSMLLMFRSSRYLFLKLNGLNNVTFVHYLRIPNHASLDIQHIESTNAAKIWMVRDGFSSIVKAMALHY